MSINKFVHNNDEKPFHSSGYAEAAHGDKIGSTTHQTFEQRMRIEKNRSTIRQYRDSLVARERDAHHRHRKKDKFHREAPILNTRQAANAGEQNITSIPDTGAGAPNRQAFREPPTRGYNPYG